METEVENLSSFSQTKLEAFLKKADLKYLIELKEYLDNKYYNTGESSGFTDYQYDTLKETIIEKDPNYQPSVGAIPSEDAVDVPYCMGSMDKIKNTEPKKLTNWLAKNKASEYIIEDKLDGVSCLYVSKNGERKLYKRGNDCIGRDISYLIPYFQTLPETSEDVVVRGELIMPTDVFVEKYAEEFANTRNFTNGLTSTTTIRNGIEDIHFVAYEIINDDHTKNDPPSQQLEKMRNMGFLVVNSEIINSPNVDLLTEKLVKFKNESRYELDGLIIYPNTSYIRTDDKYPKYARAFKVNFENDIKETTVLRVEWEATQYQNLIPVVHIEPVLVLGAVISHPTGHNAAFIRDNGIGPGAVIRVTRSNSVIPYIVDVVKPVEPQMPEVSYKWNETEIHIYTEEITDEVMIKKLISFFSHLGMKFLGKATVTKLYENGFDTIFKILGAQKNDFKEIPRFGQKTIDRLYSEIHDNLKDVSQAKVLAASGALDHGVGVKRLEVVLKNIPDILTLYKEISEEELLDRLVELEGISVKIGNQLVANMQAADEFMTKISEYVTYKEIKKVDEKTEEKTESGVMSGSVVLFSGIRNKDLERKIVELGGEVATGFSKKVTVLIVKDYSESTTKTKKAESSGIPIYTLNDFTEKYQI
jgi:NAD-dependent DNA ligase